MEKTRTNKKEFFVAELILKILYGILIGVGAVLPGVSGGVLCVIFGIYPVVMDFLSHPFAGFKSKIKILFPYILGVGVGFWGVSKLLDILLTRFEAPSTSVFVGLVAGMLPSLFVSLGKGKRRILSYIGLSLSCLAVLLILFLLRMMSVTIEPNFLWYVLCGAAIAISVIVPGMSFSTLLMPLGLYAPFVQGISEFDFAVLIPGAIGAVLTFTALSRFVSGLFKKHYSIAQNIVIGVVIAATAMIVPYDSFLSSWESAFINSVCVISGAAIALLLSRLNKKYEHLKSSDIKTGG